MKRASLYNTGFKWVKKLPKNQGFSLIGVLVASVIGLIVILGLSTAFNNMYKQTSDLKSENRKEQLFLHINALLLQPNICKNTFVSFQGKIYRREKFKLMKIKESDVDFSNKNFLQKYNLKVNDDVTESFSYMEMECSDINYIRRICTLSIYMQDKKGFISVSELDIYFRYEIGRYICEI
ncbi:MAG: prepilin-type N-terminal cleavage/methylation domain-containing protein [Bdellovibrionales bacterium]|nr:prepilin-type N-terminal cleavage/methylation domain-containing protein [Bdellovibrionales bacterium]